MCDSFCIKQRRPTPYYNPQVNSIIERLHQFMGNMVSAFELEERDLDPKNHWGGFL
jgi:hypothetical protein